MLKKKFRLVSHAAFIATYRQYNVVSDEYFKLYGGRLKEAGNIHPTKLGFVVSKKIHKRAVKRNRIKRLLRESCRLGIKSDEIGEVNNFISLIFAAKEGALELDFNNTKKSVQGLIKRLSKKIVQGC